MTITPGSENNTLLAVAFDADGQVVDDLAFDTAGISIYVQRIGQADSSPLTLSAKVGTTWAAGAFLNLTNGDISVDVADAFFDGFTGQMRIVGSFTGGVIVGYLYDVGYPQADVRLVLGSAAVINTDVGTETKQDNILAQIQGGNVVQVPSPNVEGSLVLVQGDTYDGIANPKPSWTVATDYTDGWAVKLTIRDEADAVVATHTGSVDSATLITVAMTGPTGLPMEGCPGRWQGKFDVQLSKGSSRKTIALDKCYVSEDQTRD